MPLWHDGVFHLLYLLDENHHQGLGGKLYLFAHNANVIFRNLRVEPLLA